MLQFVSISQMICCLLPWSLPCLLLSPNSNRPCCGEDACQKILAFSTTEEVEKLDAIIGQDRATRAIEFGIGMEAEGYNIFAMGPTGAGKSSIILSFLHRRAGERSVPGEWAYGRNPTDPYRPLAIVFPPDTGRHAVTALRDALRQVDGVLTGAFRGAAYEEARNVIEKELHQQQQARVQYLQQFAQERNFAFVETATGYTFMPMRKGQMLSAEEFARLEPEQRQEYTQHEPELAEAMEQAMRSMQRQQVEAWERLVELDKRMAETAISSLFQRVSQDFQQCEAFVDYVAAIAKAIVQQVVEQRGSSSSERQEQSEPIATDQFIWADEYGLNLIVDHAGASAAPVVHDINPTYTNLIGKIEYRAEFGALVPDHHTIRPGSLHRANGGYLVVDARSLLSYPMAWEGLKRALRYREILIDEPAAQAGAAPAASLAPQAIPLNVKVVMLGDPETYYDLYAYDPAFAELFKVRADFAGDMMWSSDNLRQIARFVRTRCDEGSLHAFTPEAVGEVVEYAGRVVESQNRLTTRFAHVDDILREADYWARQDGASLVDRKHVRQAIEERRYRSNLYEEEVQRLVEEGSLLMQTSGQEIGQVNALTVMHLGDYEFGRPTRITASTYLGSHGVINIERESRLSGRIHDKGVLLLTGYLGGKYGQDKPITLNASLAFEQSYGDIDGDSASAAELYALLSSLAEIPVKQGISVTGSVNQRGQIQAVGGVTAKVEGFFDVCRLQGLTGDQGVIIPLANVRHLMLRADIIDAVESGKFHIWPVRSVDEGVMILTDTPAGERDPDGHFPPDSFNFAVDEKLRKLAVSLSQFNSKSRQESPPADPASEEDDPTSDLLDPSSSREDGGQ